MWFQGFLFGCIFYAINKLLIVPSRVPYKYHIEWNSRVVSSIYSGISGIVAIYLLTTDFSGVILNNVQPRLMRWTIAMMTGYLLQDLYLLINNPRFAQWTDIFHHLFVLAFLPKFASAEYYTAIICIYMTVELSTPFLNFSWFMIKLPGWKETMLFKMNMGVFVGMFFIFRILGNIPVLALLWYQWDYVKTLPLLIQWHIPLIVFPGMLNLFWFKKIMAKVREI